MWFKNLFVYQLGSWEDSKDSLAEKLRSQALTSCGSGDLQTIGWAPPIPGQDALVYAKGDQFLLCLAKEKKLLPSSVVQQFTKARALEIEEQEGFKPGRKRMKELKEEMLHMLLPRAFTIRSQTLVWVDLRSKTLCIDAGSPNKAEEVLTILLKSLGGLDIQPLKTVVQPSAGMTQWVAEQDTPPRFFSVDAEYELKSQESEGSNIRYVNHVLESDDFNKLVSQGKRVARLALTWSDKISFTLHETLQIKRIRPLDVLQEQIDAEDEQERFDAEFLLMTGELSLLLQHLTDALGGTNTAQTHEQRRSA